MWDVYAEWLNAEGTHWAWKNLVCVLLSAMVNPSNDHEDMQGIRCHVNGWGACVVDLDIAI